MDSGLAGKKQEVHAVETLTGTTPAVLTWPSPAVPEAAVQPDECPCPLTLAGGPWEVTPAQLVDYLC